MAFGFNELPPQESWKPTLPNPNGEDIVRERYDFERMLQDDPLLRNIANQEVQFEHILERVEKAAEQYITESIANLGRNRENSMEKAIAGSELIKSIVRLNQATRILEQTNAVAISPEKSMEDILKFLYSVIDANPDLAYQEGNADRLERKKSLRNEVGGTMVGARAEFGIAEFFQEKMGKATFFPGDIEDLRGVDWWVSLGKDKVTNQRTVLALQVKSVEAAQPFNKVLYPLPYMDTRAFSRQLSNIFDVVGEERFNKIEKSLKNTVEYSKAVYPDSVVPTLAVINPLNDIDPKTGDLTPETEDKLYAAVERLSHETVPHQKAS